MKRTQLLLLFFFISLGTFAQTSPEEKISQTCGNTRVEIVYCRPSVRGRVIFGDLVPYDEVWRTGANSATTIEFKSDIKLAGKPVKAGKYALFTIPGKTEWQIILNSAVKSWGSYKYSEKEDVIRVAVKPTTQSPKTEVFTIRLGNSTKTSCDLQLLWADVLVSVPVN